MKLPIIINEAGKIYIEAVPQLAWGRGKECTFIGALEAALAVTATPHTYENLMGWSGMAFRTRWYHGDSGRRWCPSTPVGECTEELDLLRRATGWDLPLEGHLEGEGRTPADFASTIAQEIRSGRPMLAYEPQLNVTTIFGFEDEGRTLLMRDYMTDDPMLRMPIEKLGPFLCFLGQRHDAIPVKEAMLAGLQQGVDNWHRSHVPAAAGRYWYGRAAMVKWREDLLHADLHDADARRLLFFVNWWNFDSLTDARASAERFLRRNSEFFLGRRHRHVLLAADIFAEEARFLRRLASERQSFLGPWTGKGIENWTPSIRQHEIDALHHVLELETEAFGELENMLDATEIHIGAGLASTPVSV